MGVLPTNPGDAYKWMIDASSDGTWYKIRNAATQTCLKVYNSTISLGTYSSSDTSYRWRLADVSSYVNLTGFNVNDVVFEFGTFGTYSITKNNSATWSDYNDFALSYGSAILIDNTTRRITGDKGTTAVTLTHKPTGITNSFDVIIYRPATFLIHGRTSNSIEVWGATNSVWALSSSKRANNHYNSNVTITDDIVTTAYSYTNYTTQSIKVFSHGTTTFPAIFNGHFNDESIDTAHSEGGNLAYYMVTPLNGYTANTDLFVFNYPNEDTVSCNAIKFNAYLQNLADFVRTNGSKQDKASLFGMVDGITSNTNLNINIVAHSMGGLVARYYIENIGKDENVEKLITIGTPHWGSGFADAACLTDISHKLCDHDLRTNSYMFGGTLSSILDCDNCDPTPYPLTSTLNYTSTRETKYYAIAGIDYWSFSSHNENIYFELPANITSYENLSNQISVLTEGKLSRLFSEMEPDSVTDNLVSFLSQIGWKNSTGSERITFEKIYVNADSTGQGNLLNRLHGKVPHKTMVMAKIFEYLQEE